MTTSILPVITQPGGHSAKNVRRVGAPDNHQGSGEKSMVDTSNLVVLAADVVLLCRPAGEWQVLVIQRGWPPYRGCWALPGGLVDVGETFAAAARRELTEETGLRAPTRLDQVGVYDEPDRDPRGRVISVAFVGVLPEQSQPVAGDDATAARWVPVRELLTDPAGLAFDHHTILTDAVFHIQHWPTPADEGGVA